MISIVAAGGRHLRPNGDANRLAPGDRAVHDWYRFVLSFPPHLVRDYAQRFGLTGRSRVLDPFCGTCTPCGRFSARARSWPTWWATRRPTCA